IHCFKVPMLEKLLTLAWPWSFLPYIDGWSYPSLQITVSACFICDNSFPLIPFDISALSQLPSAIPVCHPT
ncbi:hypothetical protein C8J57DRAFT_1376929, partial [Mycena rebaudengoi]